MAHNILREVKPETELQRLESLRVQLDNERSSWDAHWRDIGDHVQPRRTRFDTTQGNRGQKKRHHIIDSTASMASRTFQSGMMAGNTSPSRPWFKLTTTDPELAAFGRVKKWLAQVEEQMRTVFLRSNLYNKLPDLYGDFVNFGTALIFQEEDFENITHFHSFPVGSYSLATDVKGRTNIFFREFRMTVRQIINGFARDSETNNIDFDMVSEEVKSLWTEHQREQWIDVAHAVIPNENFDANRIESEFKRFVSVYYEFGKDKSGPERFAETGKFLSKKGYDLFPALAARWNVVGEDVYGTNCPGMIALGDIRQLYLQEKRSLQAIEKIVNPPMVGPTSLKAQKTSIIPGDITYVDITRGKQGFIPAFQIDFRIEEIEAKSEQVRQRIKRIYYEDLFLRFTTSDRRQITAKEIAAVEGEILLALSPVLEQINVDVGDNLIDNTFNIMMRREEFRGLRESAPEEIQGETLKVEYISILAQAQKQVGIANLDRFTGFVINASQTFPSMRDKLDSDKLVDRYGERLSVDPEVLRSEDGVTQIREARAQAELDQQRSEAAAMAAKTAKDLSDTDPDKLEDISGRISAPAV